MPLPLSDQKVNPNLQVSSVNHPDLSDFVFVDETGNCSSTFNSREVREVTSEYTRSNYQSSIDSAYRSAKEFLIYLRDSIKSLNSYTVKAISDFASDLKNKLLSLGNNIDPQFAEHVSQVTETFLLQASRYGDRAARFASAQLYNTTLATLRSVQRYGPKAASCLRETVREHTDWAADRANATLPDKAYHVFGLLGHLLGKYITMGALYGGAFTADAAGALISGKNAGAVNGLNRNNFLNTTVPNTVGRAGELAFGYTGYGATSGFIYAAKYGLQIAEEMAAMGCDGATEASKFFADMLEDSYGERGVSGRLERLAYEDTRTAIAVQGALALEESV